MLLCKIILLCKLCCTAKGWLNCRRLLHSQSQSPCKALLPLQKSVATQETALLHCKNMALSYYENITLWHCEIQFPTIAKKLCCIAKLCRIYCNTLPVALWNLSVTLQHSVYCIAKFCPLESITLAHCAVALQSTTLSLLPSTTILSCKNLFTHIAQHIALQNLVALQKLKNNYCIANVA